MRRALLLVVAACSTGQVAAPKRARKPSDDESSAASKRNSRIEAWREQAYALVPPASTCLPAVAHDESKLRLDIAAIGDSARMCAFDNDPERLLGPVGCWNVDLVASTLTYQEPAPLPGRGFAMRVDGTCVRGMCLPEAPKNPTVQIAYSLDGQQAAVLADRRIHLFDTASSAHQSDFTIEQKADAVAAIHFLGKQLLVQTRGDDGAVWVYEPDGTQIGPITTTSRDSTPLPWRSGGVALLDASRIAIGERGFEVMTTIDLASNAETRLARKPPTKLRCKPAELEAFWSDPTSDKVGADCKTSLAPLAPFVGATLIAGRTNFLALLRGDRIGQLAILDGKTLVEKRAISLPWCGGDEPAKKSKPSSNDDDDGDNDE